MKMYWMTSLLTVGGLCCTGHQEYPGALGTTPAGAFVNQPQTGSTGPGAGYSAGGYPGGQLPAGGAPSGLAGENSPTPGLPGGYAGPSSGVPHDGPPVDPGTTHLVSSELQQALGRYQVATEDSGERTAVRNEISGLLNKHYDAHVEQYEQQIAGLESRLAKLRDHVQKRREAKSRLVALKMELLLSQADGMGWPETLSSTIPQVGPYVGTHQTLPGSTSYPQSQLFVAPGMSGGLPARMMQGMLGGPPAGTMPGGGAPASMGMGELPNQNLPGTYHPPVTMTLPQETSSMMVPRILSEERTTPAPSDPVPSEPNLEHQPSPGVPSLGGVSGYPSTNQEHPMRGGSPDLQPMAGADEIGSEAPPLETRATNDSESKQALKTILLGFHNYVSAYNKFPTQARDGHSEKLSLLVRILPYLGETDLANRFDMTQAWDSENNLALIDRMPEILGSGRRTQVRWVESDVVQFQDITDGSSNTIACIFGGQSVYWTENRPMSIVEAVDLFNSLPPNGTLVVAMYDGSVKTLTRATTVDVFKAMLTPSGGEVIPNEPSPPRTY